MTSGVNLELLEVVCSVKIYCVISRVPNPSPSPLPIRAFAVCAQTANDPPSLLQTPPIVCVFAVLAQTPSTPPSPLPTHLIVCAFAVLAPSAAFIPSLQFLSLSSSCNAPDATLRHAVFSRIEDSFFFYSTMH